MFTLGAVFLLVGIGGFFGKAWAAYKDMNDPPQNYDAKISKTRLDTKKGDGKEVYTYIVTFFLNAEKRYISFEVTQKQFDEMMTGDEGILTCSIKRKKFMGWEAVWKN